MIATSNSSSSPAASISATKASRTFMEPANTQAVPAHTDTRRLPSPVAATPTLTPPGAGRTQPSSPSSAPAAAEPA